MTRRATATKKFLFERSFDDPSKLYLPGERRKAEIEAAAAAEAASAASPQAAPSPPPMEEEAAPEAPKPEFTQGQLDAAKEQGYIEGHTAALEEAATAREHYIADAVNVISQELAKLEDQQKAANLALGEVAMRMIYGLVSKLLPEHTRQHAAESIEVFVRQVLPLVTGEPRLLLRVHSMIVEDVQARMKEVFARSGFQGTFNVVADYELQPGDCRIEWDGGGADRDEARIWRDIREAVAGNFGDVNVEALDAAADALPPPGAEAPHEDETTTPEA